jgi:hypothetical protein
MHNSLEQELRLVPSSQADFGGRLSHVGTFAHKGGTAHQDKSRWPEAVGRLLGHSGPSNAASKA